MQIPREEFGFTNSNVIRLIGTVNNNIDDDDDDDNNNNFRYFTSFFEPEIMNSFRKAMIQDNVSLFYLLPLVKFLKISLNSAKIVLSIYIQSDIRTVC